METSRVRINHIKYLAGLFAVAFLYLLVCSGYTSPLFPDMINYDSAIFMMVGKGILEGKELYAEIFDHKGPILFWLEALGMLGGRKGIFLLQVIFMTANLYLMDKTASLWKLSKKKRLFVMLLTLVVLAYPLSNGNLSEEYGLPFVFLPLYLFLKEWKNKQSPRLFYSWIYGVCFGIHLFIRVNNGISVCAIIACWLVWLIANKKYKEIALHLLIGLAGIAAITVPILLYFYARGTLYDMLYATFLFNLEYSSQMSFLTNFAYKSTILHLLILFSPLLLEAYILAVKEKGRMRWALEFIVVVNILVLFLGYGYNHYFTTAVPLVTVTLCIWFSDEEREKEGQKWRKLWVTLGRLGMLGIIGGYAVLLIRLTAINVRDAYFNETIAREAASVKSSLEIVPEEERDSILGVDVQAKYYLYGEILPCYPYGILQTHWSKSDSSIMKQTLEYIDKEAPLWVMTEPNNENDGLQSILEEKYESKTENEFLVLYRLK